jgi:hypothetical protein
MDFGGMLKFQTVAQSKCAYRRESFHSHLRKLWENLKDVLRVFIIEKKSQYIIIWKKQETKLLKFLL